MSDENLPAPVAMTMHKAVAAFLTSLVMIFAALGFKTGYLTPDLLDAVAAVIGALLTGVVTWWVSNKPKA